MMRSITLMMSTSGRSAVRKLVISSFLLWTGVVGLLVAFGAGVWGLAYVYEMYHDAHQFRAEYESLQAEYGRVTTSYGQLQTRLTAIEALESKVRDVFELPSADEISTDSTSGQGGGPEPASAALSLDPTEVTDVNDNAESMEMGLGNQGIDSELQVEEVLPVPADDAVLRAERMLRSWLAIDERIVGTRENLKNVPSITPLDPVMPHWISSDFGMRTSPFTGRQEFHGGIDISARSGTPVIAPADGVVVEIWNRRQGGSLGNALKLRHAGTDSFETLYGHLNKGKPFAEGLRVGSRVKRHDVIGFVGNTGRATASHLHYEVRRDGKRLNPFRYLLDL